MSGRPTILTPELRESICKDLADGNNIATACELNNVSRTAYSEWVTRGRLGEEPFASFESAVARARAKAKADAVKAIRAAVSPSGMPDWKGPAWLLERSFPEEYGPQQAVNVKLDKAMDEALDKLEKRLSPEEYARVLAAIAADEGEGPSGETEGR